MALKNHGTVRQERDGMIFVFSDIPGVSIRVEDSAQGVHDVIRPLSGQPVSVLWSQLPSNIQTGETVAMLIHQIAPHSEIRLRAFEIHSSSEGTDALEDWLRAERELLPGA
jgi:hypothetical protein